MTARLAAALATVAVLLVTGFSTGSAAVLLPAALLALLVLAGGVSVLLAARGLQVTVALKPDRVQRGEDVQLRVAVRCGSPLPVAPIRVRLTGDEAFAGQPLQADRVKEHQQLSAVIHTAHVGVSRPGVEACVIEDIFGFFRITRMPRLKGGELMVLPQVFGV